MSNENQIQNNKGGVKTEEGKQVSKYNAQKHMIMRESPTDYEKADAETIYSDFASEIKPSGRLQELMIEIIANNTIKLSRIAKAEAEAIKEAMSPDVGITAFLSDGDGKKFKPSVGSGAIEKLHLYSRYQTATENRIYRALKVLRQIQT